MPLSKVFLQNSVGVQRVLEPGRRKYILALAGMLTKGPIFRLSLVPEGQHQVRTHSSLIDDQDSNVRRY